MPRPVRDDAWYHAMIDDLTYTPALPEHTEQAALLTQLSRVYWHEHLDEFKAAIARADQQVMYELACGPGMPIVWEETK